MSDFLISVEATVIHPLTVLVLTLMVSAILVLIFRLRRYRRILIELRQLPTERRRYVLERHHRIYPGSDNKPIGFVERRRRRDKRALVLVAVVPIVAVLGVSVYQTMALRSATWDVDDSGIMVSGYGYFWRLELHNTSSSEVIVDQVRLRVLSKSRHPETDHKWPARRFDTSPATPEVTLRPDIETVIVPNSIVTLTGNDSRNIAFEVLADHAPGEGWIYDVQCELEWHLPGRAVPRIRTGKVYRLGWAGMVHWSSADATDPNSNSPIADPVGTPDS